jgi:hypothetical protein
VNAPLGYGGALSIRAHAVLHVAGERSQKRHELPLARIFADGLSTTGT